MEIILELALDFVDMALDALLNPVFDKLGATVSNFKKK